MENRKRKKAGKIVFALIILLIAALLVALPFILDEQQNAKTKGSILFAEVKPGSIQKTFSGTGTITEQEALEVSVPAGVEVTEYLVKNGQFVQSGDPVATADRVSVMETISAVKETMTETEEELNNIGENYYTYINAPAQGRIKAVYCKNGDAVEEVMLQHGALAVLSLDGLMGVTIPDTGVLSIGQSVSVVLSDGTEVSGRVELANEGKATITISDQYGEIDETVQVLLNGQKIGSGTLFVHSAWKAVASSGTVYSVFISKNIYCWTDGTLISIEGSSDGSYERLLEEYHDYEDLLEELFRLYLDGVFKAPADGIVSGVDEKLLSQLSSSGSTPILELVSYKAGETSYYRLGMITEIYTDGKMIAKMQSKDVPFDPSNIDVNTMTETIAFLWPPYWSLFMDTIECGNVYAFQFTSDGNSESITDMDYITQISYSPSEDESSSGNSDDSSQNGNGDNNSQSTSENAGNDSGTVSGSPGGGNGIPGSNGFSGGSTGRHDMQMPDLSESLSSFGGGGRTSGSNTTGGTGTAGSAYSGSSGNADNRYSLDRTTILSVTPQETVTVSITIDELDILDVHKGQEASVTLDALPGHVYTGTITEVNKNASNSGGHSKYSAVVELERIPNMLGGMNASVSITTENLENILTLPAEALDEQDGQIIVYTGFDSRSETLINPVSVTTGLSDGLSVQILSGLSEGDTVWYQYHEQKDEAEQ